MIHSQIDIGLIFSEEHVVLRDLVARIVFCFQSGPVWWLQLRSSNNKAALINSFIIERRKGASLSSLCQIQLFPQIIFLRSTFLDE